MKRYDYAHRQGVRAISWEEFATLTAQLAEALVQTGVEAIVGIARAGLLPATVVTCNLRRELYLVRVTHRVNDEVRFPSPMKKQNRHFKKCRQLRKRLMEKSHCKTSRC